MGMMGKIKETQKKVKEAKEQLHHIELNESSPGGLVSVSINADRVIKAVEIDDSLMADKARLMEELIPALNKAIEQAGKVHDAQISAAAKESLPNIPGLDSFFK